MVGVGVFQKRLTRMLLLPDYLDLLKRSFSYVAICQVDFKEREVITLLEGHLLEDAFSYSRQIHAEYRSGT